MKKKIIVILLLTLIIFNCIQNCIYSTNSIDNTNTITIDINQKSEDDDSLNLYSESAILIDSNSDLILYEKNAYEKMYPASTTKILTAIIALEQCNLNDMVTVSEYASSVIPSGYSSAYLVEGERISVQSLITVLLVHSANDAGYVLAEYISGSIQDFADLMNEKAKEIGCINTHFTNPSGIHDEDHYTTAYDLGLIARYCMQNSAFRTLVSLQSCTISSTNKSDAREYSNTNSLIIPSSNYYLENCIGGKTGYTSEAQNCLVSAYSKNGMELISVVLGASQTETGESARYVDSVNLYNYGYSNYSVKTFAQKDDIISTINVANGTKETRSLDLILADSISGIIKNNEEISEPIITLNEKISAPIMENDVVGTITYTVDGISYTENLLASHEVVNDDCLLFIFKIALGLIIFIILLIIIITKFKMKKRKRKRKNYYIKF